ncbi:MAG: hypothetical protein IJ772_05215 [Bacilli bacterium]|nr:hypothetical protein [Bacilli bacterium]
MEAFLNWLSNPGPCEEITLILVLLLVSFVIPFWITKLKISKVGKDGIEFGSREDKKDENKKKRSEEGSNSIIEQKKEHISYVTTQDYKIFSLILKEFSTKIITEVKEYCRKNGINLKTEDEYREYTEEKKSIYYNELKEMFRDEYVSYDIISDTDVEDILEKLRDFTFNKIENMYRKVRSISIEEHQLLEQECKEEKETFLSNLNKYIEIKNENKNSLYSLENILETHYIKCKEIYTHERISILEKQIRVIEETNKMITRKYIEEFNRVYSEKNKR